MMVFKWLRLGVEMAAMYCRNPSFWLSMGIWETATQASYQLCNPPYIVADIDDQAIWNSVNG